MRTAKTDQTGGMPKTLIRLGGCPFAGCTCQSVGFVMRRLICNLGESR